MAMVISNRAKAIIGIFTCFFLLGIVIVAGSTQGWFIPQNYYGERVAARIQGVKNKVSCSFFFCYCDIFSSLLSFSNHLSGDVAKNGWVTFFVPNIFSFVGINEPKRRKK